MNGHFGTAVELFRSGWKFQGLLKEAVAHSIITGSKLPEEIYF
jgi:hypothetical protein